MVFCFSQLVRISEFANRQTIMKPDFKLYHMVIKRLLYFDNLSSIREMRKRDENSERVEKPDLEKEMSINCPNDDKKEHDKLN